MPSFLIFSLFVLLPVLNILFHQTIPLIQAFQFTGINEAGLEFQGSDIYCAPESNSINTFTSQGHNLIRIPFAWEEIQPCFRCELNNHYLSALDNVVNTVVASGGIALIDCHNYFRYYNNLVPYGDTDAFASLWYHLANHYKYNDKVWFGLMNEPHDMSTEAVKAFHQQAIWAIRSVGSNNTLVISGNGWDSLTQWASSNPYYGTPNTILRGLDDSAHNFLFEMHLYFDYDYSGTHAECSAIDWEGIKQTTSWLRDNHFSAIVTEFGLGNNDNCVYNYGEPFLGYLNSNSDVWKGFTYWSAGPCWPNDYIYTLDPKNYIPSYDSRVQLLQKYAARRGNK